MFRSIITKPAVRSFLSSRITAAASVTGVKALASSTSTVMQQRAFSKSTVSSGSAAVSALQMALSTELAEELEVNPEQSMPEQLQELYDIISKDWLISEPDAVGNVCLQSRKATSQGDVKIEFHCQGDEPEEFDDDMDYDEDNLDQLEADEEKDDEEASQDTEIIVTITKSGGKTLRFGCTVLGEMRDEGEFLRIHTVNNNVKEGEEAFEPVIDDLNPDLVTALSGYLTNELMIDEDMTAFISMYADHSEQLSYVKWLAAVKDFVK
jgi:hypothetical protein